MIPYVEAASLEDVQAFIAENHFAFVNVSRLDCGVCHAVKPQVRGMLADFPEIKMIDVDADKVPAVAGAFSVFTVPALLFFVDGKEMFRKARFVVMAELEQQVSRLVEHY